MVFLFAVFLLVSGCIPFNQVKNTEVLPNAPETDSKKTLENLGAAYQKVMDVLAAKYPRELTKEELGYIADLQKETISKILAHLDNYSYYVSSEEEKKYGGVGILLEDKQIISDEGVKIIGVMPGTPAAEIGLDKKIGWGIVEVGGRNLKGLSSAQVVYYLIRGPVGTKVNLVLRVSAGDRDKTESFSVELTRVMINSGCVIPVEKQMLASGVGYLKLNNFECRAEYEFILALEDLIKNGLNASTGALIVDLRNNLGGRMDAAGQILSLFLPSDAVMFYVKYRDSGMEPYESRRKGSCFRQIFFGRIILLVNEFSASASEIVVGSLKDHKRAVILGKKTYGKGSIIDTHFLSGKSELKIVCGYFYSPITKKCVEREGIAPDVEIEDNLLTPQDEVLEKAIQLLK